MTREDVIEQLHEPFALLSPEVKDAAQKLSATDAEVAELWKLSQSLAKLSEPVLYGQPESSNVQFITSLRIKIDSRLPQTSKGYLGSWKLISLAASVCVVLLVVIFSNGSTDNPYQYRIQDPAALADLADDQLIDYTVNDADSVNADTLAAYLNVPSDYLDSETATDLDSDTPVIDDLLALDQSDLDFVLSDFEQTNFF